MLAQLFKKTAILSVTQVASRLLALAFTLTVARYLGTELFGEFIYAYAFIFLLFFVVNFGLSTLTVREIARDRRRTGDYLVHSLLLRLLISVAMYGVLLVHAYSLSASEVNKRDFLIILGLSLFAKSFFETFLSFFQAYERQDIYGYVQLINSVFLISIAGFVVLFDSNILLFAGAPVIALTGSSILSSYIVFKTVRIRFSFVPSFIKSLLIKTIPFGLTMFTTSAQARVSILMLSWLRSDTEVGLYAAAFRLIEGLYIIPIVISRMVYPIFSRINTDSREFTLITRKSVKLLLLAASLLILMGFVFADRIISSLYSTAYIESIIVLQILLWTLFATFSNYVLGHALFALNRQASVLRVASITLVVNIVLNVVFIPRYGAPGAAYAALLSITSSLIGHVWYLRDRIAIAQFLNTLWRALSVTVVLIAVGLFFKDTQQLAVLAIGLPVLYFILVYLIGLVEKEEISRIKAIIVQSWDRA